MEKIRVYVLTKTDTGIGFEPCEISVHTTFKDAQNAMFKSIQNKTGFSDFDKVTDEEEYDSDRILVDSYYAYTKYDNQCYWGIASVDMDNPLTTMLDR